MDFLMEKNEYNLSLPGFYHALTRPGLTLGVQGNTSWKMKMQHIRAHFSEEIYIFKQKPLSKTNISNKNFPESEVKCLKLNVATLQDNKHDKAETSLWDQQVVHSLHQYSTCGDKDVRIESFHYNDYGSTCSI